MRHLIGSLFAIGVARSPPSPRPPRCSTRRMRSAPAPRNQRRDTTRAAGARDSGAGCTSPRCRRAASPRRRRNTRRARSRPRAPPPAAPQAGEAEEDDKDPYEGIAPEELPPDLQYSADSSVSFPTNI